MKKNRKTKITQNDVARHAGVTRSMVSYVINGRDRSVAPVTRQKILDAISELEYRPNKFAQALSMGSKGVLIVNRAAGRGENALTLLLPTNLVIRKSS